MTQQFPALLVAAPLIAACLIVIAGWGSRKWCFPLALAALFISFVSAVGISINVLAGGAVKYKLGGWPPPWGIGYHIDYLNALVLIVISAASCLNLVSSKKSIEEEQGEKTPTFYSLYVLAVTGLLGMTVTGDAFNLYVLLEISSLSGYALVASGEDRAPLATLNYLFLGTIGASFYLLGVGFLYMVTGSLNMQDIAVRLPELYGSRVVLASFIMIMVGLWLKAAFFPLHAWLPGAYTYANSAASALLAPLMTKVMIYVMVRMMLDVFTPAFVFENLNLHLSIVWLAVAAIFMGALMALAQRNLKKMLTFIIISEVGYMIGGAWLGNKAGMTGAVLHIINDALMTLCVFMAVSNIIYQVKSYEFKDLQGLFHKMPFTMAGFVVAGLSIIGVPPTCGFFSKWYLLTGAVQAGHYGFMVALLFSSLISVVLFFRVLEIAYFEPLKEHGHGHGHGHGARMREAPLIMVVPLMVAAGTLIFVGFYTGEIVSAFIVKSIPVGLN